jgi:predicted metal-dependent phosphoesterase TrpH
MNVDFHSHSTASDGMLAPAEVGARAKAHGVTHWALTDHDVLSGLAQAAEAAHDLGIAFFPGVEISVTWRGQTIHIVGVDVDPANDTLRAGVATTRSSRRARADRIAHKLRALGVEDAHRACDYAEDPDLISRTHFARFLVDRGFAVNIDDAFARYLGTGRAAYVSQQWAQLHDAAQWIGAAGGIAILAHPGRYKLSAAAMDQLIEEFKAAGGRGIEVVTGSHSPDQYALYAALARSRGLLASRGSDFHGAQESRVDLGELPALPGGIEPVWAALGARGARA